MKRRHLFLALLIAVFLTGILTPCWAATYQINKGQTVVSFKIRSFMAMTQGSFRDFQGKVDYDPEKPETLASEGTIEVKSIDTKNPKRDHHLLSKDFFDPEKFPLISFKALKVLHSAKDSAQAEGLLTIHGIEKSVVLDVQKIALDKGKDGTEHLKFTATAKINRNDFGITYSSSGPGRMMLGDDVMITIQADAVKKGL